MAPVLDHHDRERFEVYCYSGVRNPDKITARLRRAAQQWRGIGGASDEQLAALVRADRIDILIDLTMHMGGCRLGAFARKPAPVQVAWLAYPGTTGVAAIDYRLTDPHLDPPVVDRSARPYSERSVRLSDTFWCYDPLCDDAPEREPPARESGRITFGCLNNFCKVSDPSLRLWSRVLLRVPESRLLMLAPEGSHRGRVMGFLDAQGVDPARLRFAAPRPRPEYLRLYQEIDVCLDTLPYNGHTTTLDALWMGVPVVTRVGQTVVGRAGYSQLTNLGCSELIARDDDAYVETAARLAKDAARLADLRRTLRARMKQSPLMDGPRFAHHLEIAFRAVWEEWCAGLTMA